MPTDIIAKTLVIGSTGKLLILKRSADDLRRPEGFDLPGGSVELGEAIVDGAIRELAEEIGLQFDPTQLRLLFATTGIGLQEEKEEALNFVWLGFVARLTTDQPVRLSHEHSSFRWLSMSEALQVCDAPTHRQFLGHLQDNNLLKDDWS